MDNFEKIKMHKRPTGISVLAILFVISGTGILILQILFVRRFGEVSEMIGVSPWYYYLSVGYLGLLYLFSGILMWKGDRRGWWLGAYSQLYGILRSANVLLTIPSLIEQYGMPSADISTHYTKHLIRIVLYLLIFLYFYKTNVLAYFGLTGISRAKSAAYLIGVIVVTAVIGMVGSLF